MSGRKVWVRCGITALIAVLLLCSSALAALKYPFYTVTTEEVRLRKTASLKAIVVENVAKGTQIEVLGKSGKFYRVSVDGTKGYIHQDYVSTAEGDVTTPVPASKATVETVSSYPYETVTTSAVNLRETKSTSSTSFAKIPAGAAIVVRAISGSWAEVEYGEFVGYVKSSYVALKKVADPTPTPTPEVTLSPEEDEASYQVLLKGSTGADVKALQQALIELGFLKGEADGKFGSATENALILFCQANDYPISVEADANLQAFLFNGKPKNAQGTATKVTVVSAVSGAVMQLGNTGDAVITLQSRLKELGYYTGSITGTYDKATKKAVMAFQKKNGLNDDGIAGKETQDLLYSSSGMTSDETPTPTPSPTPTAIPSFTIPAGKVKQGTEGEDAKLVQKRLKELGYYKGRVDGKFGAQSVKALKNFQENNGMAVDGIAGEDTYKVMFSWGALAYGCTPTPVPVIETPTPTPAPQVTTPTPTPNTGVILETLRKGDAGAGVSLMQEALINLGYLAGPADGIYGETTVKAVKNFQTMNNLTADGIAGNATLRLLYSTSAKAAAVTAAPASAKATATPAPSTADELLKKGSKGDAVKALQQKLISLGYLSGTADGIFGTATYKALVAFQKANKLSTDGIAGSATLAALSGSNAKANSTASAIAAPTASATTTVKTTSALVAPSASRVIYANWYTTVKAVCRKYPYATIYDFQTGISWQIHIFSLGAHADYEPLTANDTGKMEKVFGGNTWNPRAVWVIFADGSVYLGSTHSNPHGVQHITTNSFAGHSCLHFPRTQEQVENIGTYATSHQACIDKGWAATQAMK